MSISMPRTYRRIEGLVLIGLMKESIARMVARLIHYYRNNYFVQHSYVEMLCERVGQIMYGYEDANDCCYCMLNYSDC